MLKALLFLATAVHGVVASPVNTREDAGSKAATSFWYANVDHSGTYRGYAPHLDDADSYEVFKTVEAGNGGAIQNAIDAGTNGQPRHEQWLSSEPRVRNSTAWSGSRQEDLTRETGRISATRDI